MVDIKKIHYQCKQLWGSLFSDADLIKHYCRVRDNKRLLYSHSELAESVKDSFNRGYSSRRGLYFEKVISIILSHCENVDILYSKYIDGADIQLEKPLPESLYKCVRDCVDHVIATKKYDLRSLEDLNEIKDILYNKAYSTSLDSLEVETNYISTIDVDIGFKDKTTGKVYFYEVKTEGASNNQGGFSGVVFNHFLRYATYVFYNKPKKNDFECNFLLISTKNLGCFRRIAFSTFGNFSFTDFSSKHNLGLSEDDRDNLCYIVSMLDDSWVREVLSRIENITLKWPKIAEMNRQELTYAYTNYYGK